MDATTVAVDLAKNVFELAVADGEWHIVERHRLNRARFARFFVQRPPCRVVMEACGSAHHWARRLVAEGHTVRLLPAHYVKPYVRRSKTDRADAAALIEAARSSQIRAVPIKSLEQQQLQSLHRLRSQWLSTRQRYLATVRGVMREIAPLEEKILSVERQLAALTRADERVQQLREIPGVGLLTSTALLSTVGDIQRFPSGRHFACWLGLTPSERSSAERRRLGKISKQGDVYCRTLLVHGARSALLAAHRAQRAGKPLDRLRHWALNCERQRGHNKATVALANRLARIVWATWKYERAFDGNWGTDAV
jgi:transposase